MSENKKKHPNAKKRIKYHTNNFRNSLDHESQSLAFREDADLVLKIHVDKAKRNIFKKKKHWANDICKIFGGLLFGTFTQGIQRSINTNDMRGIILFIGLGFLGFILVIFGVIREYYS
ncbi:MAG: hypothetical protein PVF58_07755 [Candidatus Methanofastidiosia archaeon]|jgi:hypothetical protein